MSTDHQLSRQDGVQSFPSMPHLQSLRRILREAKFLWAGLTNTQRWHYHAYDYAFLRVRHGLYNPSYPLDPQGLWFNATLVDAAERIYRPQRKPQSDTLRPADTERDRDLAAHFRRQDEELEPLKRQVQIHGDRLANGGPTPEMLALMACCVRQLESNGKIVAERSRRAFAPEARMSPAQVREALGVTATERKPPAYQDPDSLRRGRVALGLEEGPAGELGI